MAKINFIFILLLCSAKLITAQKNIDLPDVKIQENRLEIPFSESTRSLEIITKNEINNLPVDNINELLQYIGGVDIRRRGANGVQADISFRGSTFEQVLVLINGVKIIDPQTGHHVMNLPIDLDIIERIEIVKGPAGRIYGQGAFAGAINIITKNPNKTKGHVQGTYGENGLWGLKIGQNFKKDDINTYISVSHEEADPGYRPNNDYTRQNVFYQSVFNISKAETTVTGSYVRNGFGANSFYVAPFDSTSYEQVNTAFVSAQSKVDLGKTKLIPSIYFRNNTDQYTFKREDPTFFQNNHHSRVMGVSLNGSSLFDKAGTIGYGIEYRNEYINSNNLGLHDRNVFSTNLEYKLYLLDDKVKLIPGASFNYYSDFGSNFLYGIDASVKIAKHTSVFGNVGTTYRIPSYTELYYEDSGNIGNANLTPEEAFNYELGIKYISKKIVGQASYFKRDGNDIIDWLRTPVITSTDTLYKWRPDNITNLPVQGLDLSTTINVGDFSFLIPLKKVRVSYTYIDAKAIQSDLGVSRYALENITNQVNVAMYWSLWKIFKFSTGYRYVDRVEVDNYHVWDMNFGINFKKFRFDITTNNVFGVEYFEFPDTPMPESWTRGTFRVNF